MPDAQTWLCLLTCYASVQMAQSLLTCQQHACCTGGSVSFHLINLLEEKMTKWAERASGPQPLLCLPNLRLSMNDL